MKYCFFLAEKAIGNVSPNPLVGALLVHNHRIIGEGYHNHFGGPHAEVKALQSVSQGDRHLIPESTLYVSLEPCNHFGKTPPCTQLIHTSGIRKLYFSCVDPNPTMQGKSISWMRQQGIEVYGPVLEEMGRKLIRPFATNVQLERPYVILKFAQTADAFIAQMEQRTKISNEITDLLVHRWRSECDAIAIGKNTLLIDDPLLSTRLWPGKSPVPVLFGGVEEHEKSNHRLFARSPKVIELKQSGQEPATNLKEQLHGLYKLGIGILMVEGGAKTIQGFISAELWDEARVITNRSMTLGSGIPAPSLRGKLENSFTLGSDHICILQRSNHS